METGTLFLDATGHVTWADPRAVTLLALIEDQRVEQPLADLLQFSPDNRRRFSEFLLEPKDITTIEQLTLDNMRIVAQLQRLKGSGGEKSAVQYQCQLSIRDAAVIERTALAAVQLRSTIQSIIAGFAHEVRNPLAAILSISEAAIQSKATTLSGYNDLARIPELVGRIESLIQQAYDYSKPALPKKTAFHVSHLISRAIEMIQPKYNNISISHSTAEPLPLLKVDVDQIERTLINLLDNAASAARSSVKIMTRGAQVNRGLAVILDIHDDGPGIPEIIQQRIFHPFFTTKAKGTGLGLAIARDLARINGGDLRLGRSTAEGTVFRLLLPTQIDKAHRAGER